MLALSEQPQNYNYFYGVSRNVLVPNCMNNHLITQRKAYFLNDELSADPYLCHMMKLVVFHSLKNPHTSLTISPVLDHFYSDDRSKNGLGMMGLSVKHLWYFIAFSPFEKGYLNS